MKWTKSAYGTECEYKGYKISRVKCETGRMLYWAHWIEFPHYAAPHWKMTDAYRSLQRVKALIDRWECDGIHFTAAELRIIKAEQHRIDSRYNTYDEVWATVRERFDSQFRRAA